MASMQTAKSRRSVSSTPTSKGVAAATNATVNSSASLASLGAGDASPTPRAKNSPVASVGAGTGGKKGKDDLADQKTFMQKWLEPVSRISDSKEAGESVELEVAKINSKSSMQIESLNPSPREATAGKIILPGLRQVRAECDSSVAGKPADAYVVEQSKDDDNETSEQAQQELTPTKPALLTSAKRTSRSSLIGGRPSTASESDAVSGSPVTRRSSRRSSQMIRARSTSPRARAEVASHDEKQQKSPKNQTLAKKHTHQLTRIVLKKDKLVAATVPPVPTPSSAQGAAESTASMTRAIDPLAPSVRPVARSTTPILVLKPPHSPRAGGSSISSGTYPAVSVSSGTGGRVRDNNVAGNNGDTGTIHHSLVTKPRCPSRADNGNSAENSSRAPIKSLPPLRTPPIFPPASSSAFSFLSGSTSPRHHSPPIVSTTTTTTTTTTTSTPSTVSIVNPGTSTMMFSRRTRPQRAAATIANAVNYQMATNPFPLARPTKNARQQVQSVGSTPNGAPATTTQHRSRAKRKLDECTGDDASAADVDVLLDPAYSRENKQHPWRCSDAMVAQQLSTVAKITDPEYQPAIQACSELWESRKNSPDKLLALRAGLAPEGPKTPEEVFHHVRLQKEMAKSILDAGMHTRAEAGPTKGEQIVRSAGNKAPKYDVAEFVGRSIRNNPKASNAIDSPHPAKKSKTDQTVPSDVVPPATYAAATPTVARAHISTASTLSDSHTAAARPTPTIILTNVANNTSATLYAKPSLKMSQSSGSDLSDPPSDLEAQLEAELAAVPVPASATKAAVGRSRVANHVDHSADSPASEISDVASTSLGPKASRRATPSRTIPAAPVRTTRTATAKAAKKKKPDLPDFSANATVNEDEYMLMRQQSSLLQKELTANETTVSNARAEPVDPAVISETAASLYRSRGLKRFRSSLGDSTVFIEPPTKKTAFGVVAESQCANVVDQRGKTRSQRSAADHGVGHGNLRHGGSESCDTDNDDWCSTCLKPGDLLCCEGCTVSLHHTCLDPPAASPHVFDGVSFFCHECVAKGKPAAPATAKPDMSAFFGPFTELAHKAAASNPRIFSLPAEIREYFKGVRTGEFGEYEEDIPHPEHATKSRSRAEERHDFFALRDPAGNIRICHRCGEGPRMPSRYLCMCPACGLHWHLDCCNPPLCHPPNMKTWVCPLHVETHMARLMPHAHGSAHLKFREIKGASPIKATRATGLINHGFLDIVDDFDDELGRYVYDFSERDDYGRRYQMQASAIARTFIDTVKNGGAIAPVDQSVVNQMSSSEQDAVFALVGLSSGTSTAPAEAIQ